MKGHEYIIATDEEVQDVWTQIMEAKDIEIDPEKFLVIDNINSAIDDLEKVLFYYQKDDEFRWKWIALSLYSVLYGFAVHLVTGTNYENVLRKDGELICFKDAIKRSQNPDKMKRFIFSKPLSLTNDEKETINLLHLTFRNNFVHFVPKTWIIDLSGINETVDNAINVIDKMVNDTGNFTSYKDYKDRTNHILEKIRIALDTNKDIANG